MDEETTLVEYRYRQDGDKFVALIRRELVASV